MITDFTSPPSEVTRAAPQENGTFGLPTATALVICSVIGTGVFAVPERGTGAGLLLRLEVGRREYGETGVVPVEWAPPSMATAP